VFKRYTRKSLSPLFAIADTPVRPREEEDEKVIGKKYGLSWGRDKIPILRKKRPAEVQLVTTIDEYKEFVADEKARIVVVRFFADWCKACKAMKPDFYKLAKELSPDVVFVEVPLTKDNAYLHQGLGVPTVPYGHIYHPEAGLVEEQSISKKNFRRFKKKLICYIDGECDLEDYQVMVAPVVKDSDTPIITAVGAFE